MTDSAALPAVELPDSSIRMEHLVLARKAMEGQDRIGMGAFHMLEVSGPIGTYVDTYA